MNKGDEHEVLKHLYCAGNWTSSHTRGNHEDGQLDRKAYEYGCPACHGRGPSVGFGSARARTPEETDWVRIVSLYTELAAITPSPIVELNRAVAVAMAFGPQQGLLLVDSLTSEPALRDYHLLPSVRGDLLQKLGRLDEARAEFERAAALTRNLRERELLLARSRECG